MGFGVKGIPQFSNLIVAGQGFVKDKPYLLQVSLVYEQDRRLCTFKN